MNYTENAEGQEWTAQEKLDVVNKRLKKQYAKIAGNTGVALFSPLLGIILNSSVQRTIRELKDEKKELEAQIKSEA